MLSNAFRLSFWSLRGIQLASPSTSDTWNLHTLFRLPDAFSWFAFVVRYKTSHPHSVKPSDASSGIKFGEDLHWLQTCRKKWTISILFSCIMLGNQGMLRACYQIGAKQKPWDLLTENIQCFANRQFPSILKYLKHFPQGNSPKDRSLDRVSQTNQGQEKPFRLIQSWFILVMFKPYKKSFLQWFAVSSMSPHPCWFHCWTPWDPYNMMGKNSNLNTNEEFWACISNTLLKLFIKLLCFFLAIFSITPKNWAPTW